MSIWYHIKPYDPTGDLIEPVNVSRETESFIWIDESQVWNGKTVVRQRRVAKSRGAWAGSYFPTKEAALMDMQETTARNMKRLSADWEKEGQKHHKITAALVEARKEQPA